MISLLLAMAFVQVPAPDPYNATLETFGTCVESKRAGVSENVTPQAAAEDLLRQCNREFVALEQAAVLKFGTISSDQRSAIREQLTSTVRQSLTEDIAAKRAAGAK